MLEDLRSLCRAAQAYEEQHIDNATLTGFLEQAAGLHAHEIAPGEPDRRITVSTIHRAKGTEAQLVVLLGCEERLLPSWRALAVTRPRAARRGAPPVLRRLHPRQGPADPHPRRDARRAPHRRPLPVPRRSRTDRPSPGARRLTPTSSKGATHHEQPQPRHHDRDRHPARTHAEAGELLRRPFAPGAIGFRAMTKVTLNGVQYGGAQVAAFLGAQSVVQRLNHVVPGRWHQQFTPVPAELTPSADNGRGPSRLYLACRLTITLPAEPGGPDVDAVYEDVGEMDAGSFAGLKALYSDARKRAGVAAGIGAYLYTALAPVVLPIGPGDRQVQAIRTAGQVRPARDLPGHRAVAQTGLRGADEHRPRSAATSAPILAHGEPETGMGQGEAAEANQPPAEAPSAEPAAAAQSTPGAEGNGVVTVDFGGLGPRAA